MEELHGLIQGADDNYMDTLICSLPITRGIATPEMCREANNFVYDAMQLYPGPVSYTHLVFSYFIKKPKNLSTIISKQILLQGFISIKSL